ncbi:MAG: hypothetical protein M1819_000068 [Sarea resinae]|nr:MAG: hypothetical protein M1819_000068 [Sarea resinae]
MSLLKGIQSALFYYVSCAPCTKSTHRRKRKQEAHRAREEKRTLEMEEPGGFHQPYPFSTNHYWSSEIMLGPGPPPRRTGKDNKRTGSQRMITTGDTESSMGSSPIGSSAEGSSLNELHETADQRLSGDGWNRRRYQREDEVLWGHDVNHPSHGEHAHHSRDSGSSVGLSGIGRAGTTLSEDYYQIRPPPVNDLHPPIVSAQPAHKGQMKWMLQPPPSAKIMSGKERLTRSRSGSINSSRRGRDPNLGKKVGERLMEEKVKRGQLPPGKTSTPLPRRISLSKQYGMPILDGIEHLSYDRNRDSLTLTESSSEDGLSRKHRPPPIIVSDKSRNQAKVAVHVPMQSDSDLPLRRPSTRPVLTPIPSDSIVNDSKTGEKSRERSPSLPSQSLSEHHEQRARPQMSSNDSGGSLKVLQELGSDSGLNSRSTSPLPEARLELPPTNVPEDVELGLTQVESIFPNKYRFPDTASKHAKESGTVMARWSMDI